MDVKDAHGKHDLDMTWTKLEDLTIYPSSYLFKVYDQFFSTSQLVRLSSQEKQVISVNAQNQHMFTFM